jgi:exopolysaccharide biosynthesis predicted pyruvyltransferase EpsI
MLQVVYEAKRIHLNLMRDLLGGKKYVVLFGLASFENKGDPAISIGEIVMLEQLNIELIFYVNVQNCDENRATVALKVSRFFI